jgi:hypothetical protein
MHSAEITPKAAQAAFPKTHDDMVGKGDSNPTKLNNTQKTTPDDVQPQNKNKCAVQR